MDCWGCSSFTFQPHSGGLSMSHLWSLSNAMVDWPAWLLILNSKGPRPVKRCNVLKMRGAHVCMCAELLFKSDWMESVYYWKALLIFLWLDGTWWQRTPLKAEELWAVSCNMEITSSCSNNQSLGRSKYPRTNAGRIRHWHWLIITFRLCRKDQILLYSTSSPFNPVSFQVMWYSILKYNVLVHYPSSSPPKH